MLQVSRFIMSLENLPLILMGQTLQIIYNCPRTVQDNDVKPGHLSVQLFYLSFYDSCNCVFFLYLDIIANKGNLKVVRGLNNFEWKRIYWYDKQLTVDTFNRHGAAFAVASFFLLSGSPVESSICLHWLSTIPLKMLAHAGFHPAYMVATITPLKPIIYRQCNLLAAPQ